MFCQNCGTQLADDSALCHHCGNPPLRVFQRIEDDPAMRLLLPVGRSVWAVLAGYAGLIAVLIFPAPLALLLGALALRDLRRHPEKHGYGRAYFGLIMGILGSLVLAFFVAIAISEMSQR